MFQLFLRQSIHKIISWQTMKTEKIVLLYNRKAFQYHDCTMTFSSLFGRVFPHKEPVLWRFDAIFVIILMKLFNKHSSRWWFYTSKKLFNKHSSRWRFYTSWRSCDVTVTLRLARHAKTHKYVESTALYYYSDLTLSQEFQPMAAQLSMEAALPLARILVTASCCNSNTEPRVRPRVPCKLVMQTGKLTAWQHTNCQREWHVAV